MTSDSLPDSPATTLFRAVMEHRCIEATYNGAQVVLAPHAAFMRHGHLHAAALTVARDGKPPREPKIGLFKVDGLGQLRESDRGFVPSALFDRGDARFASDVLVAVETV